MAKRYVSIVFCYLRTDWHTLRQPALRQVPFVLRALVHNRMVVMAANALAEARGIWPGMVLADARAIVPNLQALNDDPALPGKLLQRIAEWCIRFTPVAAVDLPDGIVLDATGCAHLWGGEEAYLRHIVERFKKRGYVVRAAMADTIGAAWGMARYASKGFIVPSGRQAEAITRLPPAALRLEPEVVERLHKLGLRQVGDFLQMPRPALHRRFGALIVQRLQQALGEAKEFINPVMPPEPYHERLPCMEPIATAKGIAIALHNLLQALCHRLQQEQKGLRAAHFKGFRVDGKLEQVSITTSRPAHSVAHLQKLFELKLDTIEPALGIELFVLEAAKVEDLLPAQVKLWEATGGLNHVQVGELVDRLAGRVGAASIRRYLPAEHYWPERSCRLSTSLQELPATQWRLDKPRPLQLLPLPERIEVAAPIPDYPPMHFRYRGKLHKVVKADGPERIEQEWWIEEGKHRDYYAVEDEEGHRYWLYRLGHYDVEKTYSWYLHGFFG